MGDHSVKEPVSFSDYLQVESIGRDVYRGTGLIQFPTAPNVSGGHLLTQALKAATESTERNFASHSIHAYFLKPARRGAPVEYSIDRLRDGATFVTRAVRGTQKGVLVFVLTVSFHTPEEAIVCHQDKMPHVPGPESLQSISEIIAKIAERLGKGRDSNSHAHNAVDKLSMVTKLPLQVRPVDPDAYMDTLMFYAGLDFDSKARGPQCLLWMRPCIKKGDVDPALPYYITTFLSDWAVVEPAILPHLDFRPTLIASLDHSIWYHQTFDPDNWLLFDCESPKLCNGIYFSTGRFWTPNGKLVASFVQEGLLRGGYAVNKL